MNFAKKLTLLFSVIVLTISVIISYLVYTSTVKTLEEQIRDKMEEQAFHTMDKIDRTLGARYNRLKHLASNPLIVSGRATPKEILKTLQVFVENSPGRYVSVSYFDTNRVRVADTSGALVGAQHPLTTYWKELAEGKDSVVDVSMSVSQEKTIIHVALAAKDAKGKTIGYIVARAPLDVIYDALNQITGPTNTKVEEYLEVDLVNRQGLILYSSYNKAGMLKDISPDWEVVTKYTKKGQTIGSDRHTHEVGHPSGEEFYAFAQERGYRDYNGDGWILILNVPTSVVFVPAVELRNRVLIILGVMSAVSLFVVAVFSRTVTRPLRALSDASAKIGMGRLDTRVEAGTKGEIGFLAESFNRMAENLKSSRDEIISSREYVSNVIHSMHESLIVITPDGVIKSVNSATLVLLGYAEEELEEEHISIVFGDWNAPFPSVEMDELTERGFIGNSDRFYLKKSGERIPVLFSASAMRDFERRIIGIVCVALDNTERKEAERALRASEERYRNLFEESKDVVFTGTLEGRVLDINKAGLEFFGFSSKADFMQTDIPSYYGNTADWERFREEVARDGYVRDFEAAMKASDGKEKTANMTANAVRDEAGEVFAYRSIMRDVTEHKRLERRLIQARKMEAIGEFTGKMAHDFKNILTVISANGSILKTRIKDDGTSAECLDLVLSSSKRATNLIQGLLAFSRNQEVTLKPVSLNRVINSAEKILSSVLGGDIEIRTDLSPGNPTVMADSGQLEQVLMNLASNAKDAMPAGGLLTVSTSLVRWEGGGLKPSEYALLTVTDTGAGMDEKTQERIFEPFFTTKETRKGTGLGLSIVYGIIDMHKGHINVNSEVGKGTAFQIFLPAVDRAEEPVIEAGSVEAPCKGTETVLLADDDPGVRKTVRFILEENGYKVVEASDGVDAVSRFVENRDSVSILVLDVRMPVKNGRQAYNEIKRIAPGIKTVFVSAYTEDIIDNRWIAEEKLGFVLKPFTHTELLHKVRELLDRET